MKQINAPPILERALNATVGIDSVYLQYKGINRFDLMRFVKEFGLIYFKGKGFKHTREWKVALAGKHSITVVYHYSSKTLTFQIGGFMNYNTTLSPQHQFAQNVMSHFSQQEVKISRVDVSFDVKDSWDTFLPDRKNTSAQVMGFFKNTVYFNGKNKTKLVMYDKATQMGIFSTSLTRFELRIEKQVRDWGVQEIFNSKEAIDKLSSKITEEITTKTSIYSIDMKTKYTLQHEPLDEVLSNFVGFLHGGGVPILKDHHKIVHALKQKHKFLKWMQTVGVTAKGIAKLLKVKGERGRKGQILRELGMDTRTFDKAVKFYKGNPKFKFSGGS